MRRLPLPLRCFVVFDAPDVEPGAVMPVDTRRYSLCLQPQHQIRHVEPFALGNESPHARRHGVHARTYLVGEHWLFTVLGQMAAAIGYDHAKSYGNIPAIADERR